MKKGDRVVVNTRSTLGRLLGTIVDVRQELLDGPGFHVMLDGVYYSCAYLETELSSSPIEILAALAQEHGGRLDFSWIAQCAPEARPA